MSQSGILDLQRDADWDAWYDEHLQIMASVPGVTSAQRFKTEAIEHPPSLAMYTFASADIFQDPYYLSIRGQGEWAPLVDKRYYHRNLFDGLAEAPEVPADGYLLVADRTEPSLDAGIHFSWLKAVAIDHSTPYRGIAVVTADVARGIPNDGKIAVYRPVTRRLDGG